MTVVVTTLIKDRRNYSYAHKKPSVVRVTLFKKRCMFTPESENVHSLKRSHFAVPR